MGEETDKETGIDLEGFVIAGQETGGGDETGGEDGDGQVKSGGIAVREGKKNKEHEGAAYGDAVHADLKIDITDPSAAKGQEGAQKEMYGYSRAVRQVLVYVPGPPIEDHRDDVRNDPLLLRAEMHGLYKTQPPEQEDGKGGEQSITKGDVEKTEDLDPVVEAREGIGMKKDEKGHDIAGDKQRMEEISYQLRHETNDGMGPACGPGYKRGILCTHGFFL